MGWAGLNGIRGTAPYDISEVFSLDDVVWGGVDGDGWDVGRGWDAYWVV